jgi:uncharacterized protein (TIGR02217 family)
LSFFDNAVFPLETREIVARPRWQTTVVRTKSGATQRAANWADSLRLYDATMGVRTLAQYRTLEQHLNAMRGQAHAFPLLDRADSTATTEGFGTGDGIATTFQLSKNDGNAANAYTREIYKPVSGTILVYDNAVLRTETTHYSINYSTGLVTFVTAPVAGHVLTWSGTFYVPVRYTVDQLDPKLFLWVQSGRQLVDAGLVTLEETRDIA